MYHFLVSCGPHQLVDFCLFGNSHSFCGRCTSLRFWFLFLWRLIMLNLFSCVCWPFVFLPWEKMSIDGPLPIFNMVLYFFFFNWVDLVWYIVFFCFCLSTWSFGYFCLLISSRREDFNFAYKTVLGAELPQLFFSWRAFISSSYVKDTFAGWRILGYQFLYHDSLRITFHSLLDCGDCSKKFVDNPMQVSL